MEIFVLRKELATKGVFFTLSWHSHKTILYLLQDLHYLRVNLITQIFLDRKFVLICLNQTQKASGMKDGIQLTLLKQF